MTPDWLIGRPVDWLDWIDAGYTRRLLVSILTVDSSAELLRCLVFALAHARFLDSIESSAQEQRLACVYLRFQRTSFLSLFCFLFFSFGGNFNCATEYIGRFKQSYGNQKRRRYFRESRIRSRTKYAFSVVFFLYRCIKFVFSLKSLESFNFWWTFLINSYFYDFLGCWRIFCEVRIVMSMKRKLYIFIHVSIKKSIVFNWMTDT